MRSAWQRNFHLARHFTHNGLQRPQAGPPQPVVSFMPLPTPPVPVHTQQLPAASAPHPAPLLLCAPGVSSSTAHTPNGAAPLAPSVNASPDMPPNTGMGSVPMDTDPARDGCANGAHEQQVLVDNATPGGQQARRPGSEQGADPVKTHMFAHHEEPPAYAHGHGQQHEQHHGQQHNQQQQLHQQQHQEPHTPAPGANPGQPGQEQPEEPQGQQQQPQPPPQREPMSTAGPPQARILQECKEVIGGVRDLLFPPREGEPNGDATGPAFIVPDRSHCQQVGILRTPPPFPPCKNKYGF